MDTGLLKIRAFGLSKEDAPFEVGTLDALNVRLEQGYLSLWLDIENPTQEALENIRDHFNLSPEAIEDCLQGDQRPRIDEYEDKLFLVVYGAVNVENLNEFSPNKIAMFWNKKYLITVHHKPSMTIRTLQKSFQMNTAHILRRGTDYLLYLVLDQLVDYFLTLVDSFDDKINDLDSIAYSESADDRFMSELHELRRDFIEMRRIAMSQRELLFPIANGQYEIISEELEPKFAHVVDHLTQTVEIIDGLRELLHGVRDNYQAVLSMRLNRIMHTLTLFASLFMPITFIAGVYGMNTQLWPDPAKPATFWIVLGVMFGISIAMLVFFRSRKWL